MGIRKYKPTTPGRRGASVADFVEITRDEPEKSLLAPKKKSGGRNNYDLACVRLAESLLSAEFDVIADANHLLPVTHPDMVSAFLLRELAE